MQTTINGRKVGYDEVGSVGYNLLFIHGFPLNRTIWQPQLAALGDLGHLLAPDLRGFGESDAGDGAVTVDTYADDLAELLDSLKQLGHLTVVGHSMGGYVALAFLRKYSYHVDNLILVNTKMTGDTEEGKAGRNKNIALAQDKGAAAIAEAMLPKMLAPSAYTDKPELVAQAKAIMESASVPGLVGGLSAMRDRPDSTDLLANYREPVYEIGAEDDQLIPLAESIKIRDLAKNGDLVSIGNAGHLVSLEQPEQFNKAMRAILQAIKENK